MFAEFLALALLFLVWVRPLWSNTEKMSFTDFAKFLYDVEHKMEMFTEIQQDYALYDAITCTENSFIAPELNENFDKSASELLQKLLQRAQPWKKEIGSFFRKAVGLMKHRVIAKNSELFIMHRFIDSSYSLTNSAQESVFARLKYVKHENSTTKPENVESLTLWRYNKLQEWLSEKTDDERNRLIAHARSLTSSIKKCMLQMPKKFKKN